MVEAFERFLLFYSLATLAVTIAVLIVTAVLLHMDKCFGLALMCFEVTAYVVISSFGLMPLSELTVTVGGERMVVGVTRGSEPPFWFALVVMTLTTLASLAFMVLWRMERREARAKEP